MSVEVNFEYAPSWRPEPNDVLKLKVTALDWRMSDYNGEEYPIQTGEVLEERARTEDGWVEVGDQIAFHAFHAVAKSEIVNAAAEPGERIAIWFGGKQPTADGQRTYAAYRVKPLDRQSEKFDYTRGQTPGDVTPLRAVPDIPADVEGLDSPPAASADTDDIPF